MRCCDAGCATIGSSFTKGLANTRGALFTLNLNFTAAAGRLRKIDRNRISAHFRRFRRLQCDEASATFAFPYGAWSCEVLQVEMPGWAACPAGQYTLGNNAHKPQNSTLDVMQVAHQIHL